MPHVHRPRWRLAISDDPYPVTALSALVWELGPIVPTSLDVEIKLASGAAPSVRSVVTLYLEDLGLGVSWLVFRGRVQETKATSRPNRVLVRCLDDLALLRDTWDADVDLSGLTDGQAVESALGACDIDFASANIQDAGLELGTIVPVVGTRRTQRAGIVKQLNDLLGMALVTIDGTPYRFAYTLVPRTADIVRTFVRGESVDFWGNERGRGAIDDIRNAFTANGPSFDCDGSSNPDEDGACRCVPTASGHGSNAALGSGVRTETVPATFQAAQRTDVLEAYVTRKLEERNRVPDRITVRAPFNPTIVIGHTIGVSDPIAGVHLTGDAGDTPFLITRIEVRGNTAIYQCVGGAAGDVDAVTSGVERQCNKTHAFGGGIGTGFALPAITPPPSPDSTALGCVDLLDAAHVGGWLPPDEDLARWATEPGRIAIRSNVKSGTPSQGRYPGLTVPVDRAWRVTVGFTLTQTAAAVGFGISQSAAARDFRGAAAGSTFGAIDNVAATVFPTSDGHSGSPSVGVPHTAVLTWLPSTNTLTLTGLGADVTIAEPTAATLWTIGAVPFLLANLASGGDTAEDAVVVTQYELCPIEDPGGCADLLDTDHIGGWTEDTPTVTEGAGELGVGGQAQASFPGVELDWTADWTLDATINVAAAGNPQDVQIGFFEPPFGFGFAYLLDLFFENPTTPDTIAYLYAGTDFTDLSGACFDPGTDLDLAFAWTAATKTLDLEITDGTRTETMSTTATDDPAGGDLPQSPVVLHLGQASDPGLTVTRFAFCQEAG